MISSVTTHRLQEGETVLDGLGSPGQLCLARPGLAPRSGDGAPRMHWAPQPGGDGQFTTQGWDLGFAGASQPRRGFPGGCPPSQDVWPAQGVCEGCPMAQVCLSLASVLPAPEQRDGKTGARLCTRDPRRDLRLMPLLLPWPLPPRSSSDPAFHARSCSIDILEPCKGGAGGPLPRSCPASLGLSIPPGSAVTRPHGDPLPLAPFLSGSSTSCSLTKDGVQAPQRGEGACGGLS